MSFRLATFPLAGAVLAAACIGWLAAALASAAVPAGGSPVDTAAPVLSGTPSVGKTLTCSTGAWAGEPTGFGYVWLRDGRPIAGQTGSTYVVQAADRGHALSCQVDATVGAGQYTIIGLPSGAYKLVFRAGSFGGAEEVGNYLTTYYHQEFSSSEANRVSVNAGAVTPGIDATMPAGGEITGTVTDAATHSGVPGVRECAELEGSEEACSATNAAGEYTLSGLPSGSYTVWFNTSSDELRGGWSWTEWYDGKTTRNEATHVAVSASGVTSGIDVELHTGQIVGTVTSAAGYAPLAGIEVCAWSVGALPMEESPTRGCVLTDSGGNYTISRLRPGAYQVQFSAARIAGDNYLSQYYSGAATEEKAAEVDVASGATTTGIDAQLLNGGQIAGRVTSATTHAPLETVSVCASPTTTGVGTGECTSTNAAGEYTVSGLATGSYAISFSTGRENPSSDYLGSYFDGKATGGEATPVTVTAGSVTTGINGELQTGGQIAGTVTAAATGAGIGGILVCAENSDRLPESCTHTDAAGDYTIPGLPGSSARVEFTRYSEGPNYLSQLYAGQVTSSAAALVPIMPGGLTGGIDAQLLTGGQITGRVTNTGGSGIAGVTVCAEHVGPFSEAFSNQLHGPETECAVTATAGGSTSATSNTLAVPHSLYCRCILRRPTVQLAGGPLFDQHGTVTLRLTCSHSVSYCAGTVTITTATAFARASQARRRQSRQPLRLGSAHFRIRGGKSARVKIRLARSALARLAPRRHIEVRVLIRDHDMAGTTVTATSERVLHLRPSGNQRRLGVDPVSRIRCPPKGSTPPHSAATRRGQPVLQKGSPCGPRGHFRGFAALPLQHEPRLNKRDS